ncbi:MAG: hypothetical protein ACTSX6_00220 [Candidatus Heimdallarchaeaceae archaeon]
MADLPVEMTEEEKRAKIKAVRDQIQEILRSNGMTLVSKVDHITSVDVVFVEDTKKGEEKKE